MKKDIEQILLGKGYKQDGDSYVIETEQVTGAVIVNGVQKAQTTKVKIEFEYIGEGWEGRDESDSRKLTQWAFGVNGEPKIEVLVHDVEEFKDIFKKLL